MRTINQHGEVIFPSSCWMSSPRRGDDVDDLGESREEFLKKGFEDPERSDILMEKQVKEGKRKR